MLTMVLTQVGLPIEGIALILGVDRLMDMIRTAVNITGDAVVSVIVAPNPRRKLDIGIYNDPEAGTGTRRAGNRPRGRGQAGRPDPPRLTKAEGPARSGGPLPG